MHLRLLVLQNLVSLLIGSPVVMKGDEEDRLVVIEAPVILQKCLEYCPWFFYCNTLLRQFPRREMEEGKKGR